MMMIKGITILFIPFLIVTFLSGQDIILSNIDSFDYFLEKAKGDYRDIDSNLNYIKQANYELAKNYNEDKALRSLIIEGNIYLAKQELIIAKDRFYKAQIIAKKNKNHELLKIVENSLSVTYQRMGEFLLSQKVLEESFDQNSFLVKRREDAVMMANLGKLRILTGDYYNGINALKKSLKYFDVNSDDDCSFAASSCVFISFSYNQIKEFKEAEKFSIKGFEYLKKCKLTADYLIKTEVDLTINLIESYSGLNRLSLALLMVNGIKLDKTINTKIRNDLEVKLLISKAKINFLLNNYDVAEKNAMKSLKFMEDLNDQSQLNKKLEALLLIGKIGLKLNKTELFSFVEDYLNVSKIYSRTLSEEAENSEVVFNKDLIEILAILIEHKSKEPNINVNEIKTLFKDSEYLLLKQRLYFRAHQSRNYIFSKNKEFISSHLKFLIQNGGNVSEILSIMERNKSLSIMESFILKNSFKANSRINSFISEELEIKSQINFYKRKIDGLDSINKLNCFDSIQVLKNKYDILISKIKRSFNIDNYSIDDFLKGDDLLHELPLSNNNVIIEIFEGTNEIFVCYLSKEKKGAFFVSNCDISFDGINEFLTKFNDSFTVTDPKFENLRFNIYNEVIKPCLADNTKEIVFVPDGNFLSIPLETLLTKPNDRKSFFVKEKIISYQFSIHLWLKMMNQKNNIAYRKDFVGFAPQFEGFIEERNRNCSKSSLGQLSCNKNEVESIFKLIMNSKSFLSDEATSSEFKENSIDSKILHLATHSCFDETNPGLSKIYFSDGYLTTDELSLLEINNELTVLSACNTGNGAYWEGEGIMSLAKGFFQAGSRSLLTAQWSIDDCVTPIIIEKYYRHLKNGERKDRALQLAKIEFIEENPGIKSHPYFWAGLVQFGDCSPIEFSKSPLEKSIPYALAIIPIGLGLWYRHRRKKAA